jgi:serine/threonine protein phosphatase PrpC
MSIQGQREYQEDRVAFLYTGGSSSSGTTVQQGNSLAVAVYDGHGGDAVSKELERVLLQVTWAKKYARDSSVKETYSLKNPM